VSTDTHVLASRQTLINYGRTVWLLVLGALLLLLYEPTLKALILQWWSDPDYSHGFLVPVFSGYMLWCQRRRWLEVERKPSNVGMIVMLGAIGLLLGGALGAELFVTRTSLLFLLGGMILFLSGWPVLRAVSFPLFFLAFMIPIPAIVYNQLTFPLQLIASRWATGVLEAIHIPIFREGNILVLPNYSLEVVEACSGIRSLMSLIALAVAYLYVAEDRLWLRCALVPLMIPIAMFTNALRISGAGILAYRVGPEAAEGFLHGFSDWVMFIVAFFLMMASQRFFSHLANKSGDIAHV
jgi:exosortase